MEPNTLQSSAPMTFDEAASGAFAERMMGMLNHGALSLMISIGHRTGLFDTMAGMAPSTSKSVAQAAGLNERYVREWLGAMVTGGVVDYDAAESTYRLPAEHAAWLTRAASPNNIAVTVQYLPLLASVEDAIVDCFRNGGGVPYSAFGRFHEIMAEESAQTVVAGLADAILPLVPGLTERLNEGIEVVDVGCGSGMALVTMAELFPNSRFTGYDLSEEAVTRGRREALRRGLVNVSFAVQDAAQMNDRLRFDLVTTFDAVHDQADPARVLNNIARALKPDGVYLMQDIAAHSHVHDNLEHPVAPFLYTISCLHCMTVSLAQGGAGLGAVWGRETATRMLNEAGFAEVRVEQLDYDVTNYWYICRKG